MSTPKPALETESPHVPGQDEVMPLYLKEWRKHRRLTQDQLAEAIGTQKSYVSKWETRDRALRDVNWINKICEVLKIDQKQLSKMPPKSHDSLGTHKGVQYDTERPAAGADPTEGIEMVIKRADLHAAIEELPDDLIDTAVSLINRLKGAKGPSSPHPSKRGSTKA